MKRTRISSNSKEKVGKGTYGERNDLARVDAVDADEGQHENS